MARQHEAGTPVTILYQLSTPVTFTNDAIKLIPTPDQDGKVTISGEDNLSVTYAQSMAYTLSHIMASIENLQEQFDYIRTRST